MPRPALTRDQIHTRREEFLDLAQDLFDRQGLEAVSLRRLAALAGCSPATPYRYFASKGHVLLGLRTRAFDRIRDALEEATQSETEPGARLRAIAAAYLRFAIEHSDAYALLFEAGPLAQDDPDLERAKREALEVCSRTLAEAEASGDLALRTDALTAAHLFWAAAHGAVSLHLGGQLVMGRSLDEIVPILITTLTTGLTRTGDLQ